jgi:predicted alpha/beta superfamily hydrolase
MYTIIGLIGLLVILSGCDNNQRSLRERTEYKLYFLGGQSNMEGFGFNKDLPPDLNKSFNYVMIFQGNHVPDNDISGGNGVWELLQPGHGTGYTSDGKVNTHSDRFGPELSFGAYLQKENPDQKIAIIKYSRGGSSLQEGASGYGTWEPDCIGGNGINQYDNFLKTLKNAFSVNDIDGDGVEDKLVPAGIIWMQGESDAEYSETAALAYEKNLKRMIDLIRAALWCDDLPVVIGLIADSGNDEDGKMMDYIEIVQKAQQDFVNKDHFAKLVSSTEIYDFSDDWHYTSNAYIDLGKKFAEAVLKIEKEINKPIVVKGKLIEIPTFESWHIRPHYVNILLPENYDSTIKYPVIYMHDGQNLYQSVKDKQKDNWVSDAWKVDVVLDSLYKIGSIPEVIVVGIYNNRTYRYNEYMPQKSNPELRIILQGENIIDLPAGSKLTSDGYLKFIVNDLKPYIDKNYSTLSDKDHTIIIGSSMGGLISIYALCEYPDVFGKAACLSTHWQADDGVFIDKYLSEKIPAAGKHKIYFDYGTIGLDAYYESYQIRVDSIMERNGYNNKNWTTLKFIGADHSETAWRKRLDIPLTFLLGNN